MEEVKGSRKLPSSYYVSLYPKDIERQLYSYSHYRTGWGLESHDKLFSVTPHPNSTGWGQLLNIVLAIYTSITSAVIIWLSLKDKKMDSVSIHYVISCKSSGVKSPVFLQSFILKLQQNDQYKKVYLD